MNKEKEIKNVSINQDECNESLIIEDERLIIGEDDEHMGISYEIVGGK